MYRKRFINSVKFILVLFLDNKIKMYNENILNNSYTFISEQMDDKHYIAVCILNSEEYIWDRNNIHIISIEDLLLWKDKYLSFSCIG